MLHLRKDYDAIQPWPVKRPHIAKVAGKTRTEITDEFIDGVDERYVQPIIPDDEPVFLLRAKDPVSSDVVRFWAQCAELAGSEAELVAAVRDWADRMEAYRNGLPDNKLAPDTPRGLLRQISDRDGS
jgi:hypothetical protein